MGGLRLIATFGWLLQIQAAAALFTGLIAAANDDPQSARVFIAAAALMAFVATSLIVGFRGHGTPSRRRHGLALVLASWIVLPAFGAIPFMAIAQTGPLVGYFEAVSVFTTTGATTLPSLDRLPRALVLWRAQLEWLGGLLTVVMAAAAFAGRSDSGQGGIHLLSSALANVSRLKAIARDMLPLYGLLTLICVVALSLAGLPAFDAVCLALSTISTGGAMPRDGDLAHFGLPLVAPILCVFMILGATSFVVLRGLGETGRWRRFDLPAFATRLGVFAIVVAMMSIAFAAPGGEGGLGAAAQAAWEGLFATVSLVTTTAFVHDSSAVGGAPLALVVSIVIVGGAHCSTSGGIKIERVARMVEVTNHELDVLVHPSVVAGAERGSPSAEPRRILWSYLIVYLMTVVAVATILAGSGLGFEAALLAAAGSISNAGPVIDYLGQPGATQLVYASLTQPATGLVALAMILGRIEILAVLAVLTPLFWTR
jgi:trk system potassium uptake protein TrkH